MIWRNRTPADDAALRAAHRRQCRELGFAFPFPELDDPRYLAAWVAEDRGEIAGAIAVHATVEAMILGGSPRMLRAAVSERTALEERFRGLGCDEIHAFIPQSGLRRMEPILSRLGFRRSNESFKPFYREV